MEKLVLTPNRPEVIALAFTQGKPAPQSKFNGPQVMYTLIDNRIWFADLEAAEKVDALSLGRGEPCEVTMCVDRQKKKSYEVRYVSSDNAPAVTTNPTPAPPAVLSSQRNGTPAEVGPLQTNPTATTTGSALMSCFMSAIDAIAEAQAYCARRGLGVTFTAEDVRATAISAYIGMQKGGR